MSEQNFVALTSTKAPANEAIRKAPAVQFGSPTASAALILTTNVVLVAIKILPGLGTR